MVDFTKLVLAADTSQMKEAAKDLNAVTVAGAATDRQTSALTRTFRAAALATVAVSAAAGLAAREFVSATVETQRVQAQLEAAIASTGMAAGRTLDQLNAQAMALQGLTVFGDEATNAMQALLLTFTSIQGEQFDQATRAVQNLATAMGSDLNSAALQVGKALNDPLRGLTSLGRAGVQFSEDQKKTIESLVELGDTAGAQTVILAELERQFGGSAEAARETLGGALTSLGNSWGDLFELSEGASEGLRLSIESLIDTISDPAFVAAFQEVGSTIFSTMNAALQSLQGLQMAVQDLGYLLGLTDTTWLMDQAFRSASEAMDENVRAASALTRELPRGVQVSKDMAEAKLEEAEAYLAATRAAQTQALAVVTQSNEYRGYSDIISDLQDDIEDLVETLEQAQRANENAGFEQFNTSAIGGEITGLRIKLMEAQEAQEELLAGAADLGPEYVAVLTEINRIKAAIAEASGETFVLEDATGRTANTANVLSSVLSNMYMSGQAIGQAALLAESLGIALDVATRLNATLNQNAGIEVPDTPSLGFGLGSTMDDPLANGMANTVLGFGNVAEAADETWRTVEDLTGGVDNLAEALSGGSGGGASGSAEELSTALELVVNESERAKNSLDDGQSKTWLGEMVNGLGDSIDEFGGAFEDFIDSNFEDFEGFTDALVDTFADAIGQMAADAATAQLGQSLGMFAGPIGGIVGSLAGNLLGGLFGGKKSVPYEQTEQYDIDQEKADLIRQQHELMGHENYLRKQEIRTYDDSNQALAKRVQALQYEADVAAEAEGIQMRLWELEGDIASIREAELATLEPANRELMERVYLLEDEAAIEAQRLSLEEQWLQLTGDETALREMQLSQMDESLRAMQLQIWAEQDRQKAIDESTRAIQDAVAAIKPENYASEFAYERDLALARNGYMSPGGALAYSPIVGSSSPGVAPPSGASSMSSDPVLQTLQLILSRLTALEVRTFNWDRFGLYTISEPQL